MQKIKKNLRVSWLQFFSERVGLLVPLMQWLPTYQRAWLRADVLAGVTVAAFGVPESMAFATLAGLPLQAGLYASFLAALTYVLFGQSRQLVLGPTSALSVLVASGLGTMALGSPARYATMASALALLVGFLCFGAWLLRLGVVSRLLSRSVLIGTSAGAAFYIGSTQLPKLFGIHGEGGSFFTRVWYVLEHLRHAHVLPLAIGLTVLLFLFLGERFFPSWPNALLAVLLSLALMGFMNLARSGVAVLGTIPRGFPVFSLPRISLQDLQDLFPLAVACTLVSYFEGIGMVHIFAQKHDYLVDDNQELLAFGVANAVAGLGQGYVVGGSFVRSAVNNRCGARTALANLVAAFLLGMVTLFLANFFGNIPEAVLAAIVLVAVRHLVELPEIWHYYCTSRRAFSLVMVTFFGVLFFGILEGLLLGIGVSLMLTRLASALDARRQARDQVTCS